MRVAISGFAALSCLGDAEETFAALCLGRSGLTGLQRDTERLGVDYGYEIVHDYEGRRATRWLGRVVQRAVSAAGVDPAATRVAVVVGSGLRELPDAEWWWIEGDAMLLPQLHFASAVRSVLPGAVEVLTISNACAASGYALSVGADMLAAGEADAVVVAGCDSVTDSLLAVIGRGSPVRSGALRPFDADRQGVLLGEGAVAVVLEPEDGLLASGRKPLARLLGVGVSCDAFHETAPHQEAIARCMRDAQARAGVVPADIDLVLTHGTGTALNDPIEARALADVFGETVGQPRVTAIKGAIGHTSGAAALMSLVVAIQAMDHGIVPAVHGLTSPIREAAPLGLVVGDAAAVRTTLAQVNAFGFGGVNSVALVGAAR